ncbi:MAG TPA: glycosyltransferase family 4 protein [Planctomycetota bacterium]|nr:glycosyltransferase family 4 protein [Planctomycetota bacterium]
MSVREIIIIKGGELREKPPADAVVYSVLSLKQWLVTGELLKHLFRYPTVRALVVQFEHHTKPLFTAVGAWILSRKETIIEDASGLKQRVDFGYICTRSRIYLRDLAAKGGLLRRLKTETETLLRETATPHPPRRLNLSATPVYLRTDLVFGLKAGGSVGHIAGVLNNLDCFTGAKPVFISTDRIPTTREDLEKHILQPVDAFRDFINLQELAFNDDFIGRAREAIGNREVGFVYQRYSMGNFSGVRLSRERKIPFVLEYNGSEIWVARNWGRQLNHEKLYMDIEMINLQSADVIVVISTPLKEELVSRGIDAEKILVNPNGVDPAKYSPDVDGSAVRERYKLQGKTVIGFIGTFGKWHGAEVLAEAFGKMLQAHPELRENVRLLMIGDGMTMPQVKEALAKYNVGEACILTGTVPQQEGPAHLSACDILASPHVPNPDGTKFFGSPTKLFEYMAMGKGIVASKLDQIGDVLAHDDTAFMVEPGKVDSLVAGMRALIQDVPLRERLGRSAREAAVAKFSWKEHTRRIVDKLKERSVQ